MPKHYTTHAVEGTQPPMIALHIPGLKPGNNPEQFILEGATLVDIDYQLLASALRIDTQETDTEQRLEQVAQYARMLALADILSKRMRVIPIY